MVGFAWVVPTELDYISDDRVLQIEIELVFGDFESAYVVQFFVDQNEGGKNECNVGRYPDAIELA